MLRIRYSLRLLLLVATLLAVLFAWFGHRWRIRQAEIRVASTLGRYAFNMPAEPYRDHIVALDVNNSISNEDLRLISRLPHLRKVDLSGTGVTDNGLESVCDLQNLEELDLSRVDLSGVDLQPLTQCRELRRLDLAFSNVTDAHLSQLSRLGSLEELVLSCNDGVRSAGMEHVANLTSLRRLDLFHTGVTECGLAFLTSLPHLEELELSGMQISTCGVAHLCQLKSLKRLRVVWARISPAEVETLKESLPDTEIID